MSLCRDSHGNVKPVRKRIIICCDGTWQSSVSGEKNVPSNVTRLCRALNGFGVDEKGEPWQQIVWYDSGVGTTSLALGKAIEGAVGQGLEGNVIEAYNFCVMNYTPDDQIMCFGFSRGAYTARTIAGLISDIGICEKKDLNRFPDLWEMYKTRPNKNEPFYGSDSWFEWIEGKADEHQGAKGTDFFFAKRGSGDWAQPGSRDVEVVGVYDTVGAIGIPAVLGVKIPPGWLPGANEAGWQNVTLSANVKHAFQALALDEHREAFSPTLWYLPKFGTANAGDIKAQEKVIQAKAEEWDTQLQAAMQLKASGKATDKQVNTAAVNLNKAAREVNKAVRVLLRLRDDVKHKNHPRTLKQVWFPGYHIHIGGGSNSTLKQEGDMEEMSNITFSWMLDQIKPFLFLNERYLDEERGERDRILEAIPENPQEGEFWGSWVGRSVTAAASVVRHPFAGAVELSKKFRKYGWGTGILEDSFTSFYHLNGSKRRTPGNYDILDKAGQPLGDTCEFIHPVVGYRHDAKGYQPIGGAPYKRYQTTYTDDKDQNKVKPCFEYTVGEAHRPLREWQLGGVDSYERLAIVGDDAVAYVTKLDAALGLRDEMPRRARPEDAFNQGGISPAGFSQGGFQRVAVSDEGFVENSLQEQHEFLSSEISSKGFQMTSEEIMFQETVMRG